MSVAPVPDSQGLHRPYEIVLDLIDDQGAYHWPIEVIQDHGAWMAEEADADRPYLSGVFQEATASRIRRDDNGVLQIMASPCVVFSGRVSPERMAAVSDADVAALLDQLAGRLAGVLSQSRAHVAFSDLVWRLEITPAG